MGEKPSPLGENYRRRAPDVDTNHCTSGKIFSVELCLKYHRPSTIKQSGDD